MKEHKNSNPKSDRFIAFWGFCTTGLILGLAIYLSPNPKGFGTHQQLGLQQCGFITFWGIPCMMCGMTTSFAHYAHFEIAKGFVNQPFSLVLFLGTLQIFIVSCVELISPSNRLDVMWDKLTQMRVPISVGFFFVMIFSWFYKIYIF